MQPTKKGQNFSHSDGKDILTVSCFMRTSSEHRYRTLEELKEYFNKYREDIWVMSEESGQIYPIDETTLVQDIQRYFFIGYCAELSQRTVFSNSILQQSTYPTFIELDIHLRSRLPHLCSFSVLSISEMSKEDYTQHTKTKDNEETE